MHYIFMAQLVLYHQNYIMVISQIYTILCNDFNNQHDIVLSVIIDFIQISRFTIKANQSILYLYRERYATLSREVQFFFVLQLISLIFEFKWLIQLFKMISILK
jgi:hypothetical protein